MPDHNWHGLARMVSFRVTPRSPDYELSVFSLWTQTITFIQLAGEENRPRR